MDAIIAGVCTAIGSGNTGASTIGTLVACNFAFLLGDLCALRLPRPLPLLGSRFVRFRSTLFNAASLLTAAWTDDFEGAASAAAATVDGLIAGDGALLSRVDAVFDTTTGAAPAAAAAHAATIDGGSARMLVRFDDDTRILDCTRYCIDDVAIDDVKRLRFNTIVD